LITGASGSPRNSPRPRSASHGFLSGAVGPALYPRPARPRAATKDRLVADELPAIDIHSRWVRQAQPADVWMRSTSAPQSKNRLSRGGCRSSGIPATTIPAVARRDSHATHCRKTAVESPLAGLSFSLKNRISWDAWKVCGTQTSNRSSSWRAGSDACEMHRYLTRSGVDSRSEE